MATYPNIGGMLTSAGARQGQQLGQAFTGLGQNLMKPVDNLLARKKNEGLQKEVQDFLAANKDDPAALNAEATRYTTMGKNDIARVFTEAAQRAVKRKTDAAGVVTAQGNVAAAASNDPAKLRERANELAKIPGREQDALNLLKMATSLEASQNKERTDRGVQGGLTAITQASSKLHNARLAKDSKAVQEAAAELKEAKVSVVALGGTAEQIRNAEEAGRTTKEADDLSLTTSTILIDGVPTVVQTATNKETGEIVSQNTIGTTEGKGKGESKKGLTALFAEQGVEVDLDTVDGIRAARNVALTDLSNASLAGLLDEMLVRKLPMNAADSVKMVRDSDPAFALNEELVEKAGRFKVLSDLGKDDVAGVAALIERTVTSTTENDLRAVAELDRFRGSKDIKQSLVDWGTMLASGKLSEDTLLEYTQIMTGLEKLAKNRISDSIDRLSVAAVTEKEQAAIDTARKYFGLEDSVEIINQ